LLATAGEERIRADNKPAGMQFAEGREGGVDLAFGAGRPVSLSPWRNAAIHGAVGPGAELPRKPITGIAFCCARRARAAVIAPPRRSISSRRFTR
jgi:hypothetical protein